MVCASFGALFRLIENPMSKILNVIHFHQPLIYKSGIVLFRLNLDTLKAYGDVKHCTGILSARSTNLALFGFNLDTLKA